MRKILNALFTILMALILVFSLMRLSPGDPVERILGPNATEKEIQVYRQQLGLNQSFPVQLSQYLIGVVKGDLGVSLFKNRSVVELLKEHFVPTAIIAFFSVFISALFGPFLGLYSALKKSQAQDSIIRILSLGLLSFPIFSLAPILVLIFSIKLGVFPVSEWGSISHIFLPVLTLVLPLGSILLRVSRNRFLEECSEPWVQVLHAKGLREKDIHMRVAKACLPTILTVIGIQLSIVIAGTMITETIFDIPGMGTLLLDGIQNRDYPVVQGIIIYSMLVYMIIYFFFDYLGEKIDPRLKMTYDS